MSLAKIKSLIRDVPDFPKPGIIFKDITPVLRDADALAACIDLLEDLAADMNPDVIAGPESRGFIFGTCLAARMRTGFVPIRKPGKLPWKTHSVSYELEYGSDSLEVHQDALGDGHRVLLVDDLLATGGTMEACSGLVGKLGGSVAGCLFVIELGFLKGRERLQGHRVESLLTY